MSGTTGKKAVLTLNDQQFDLPIYSGTLGPDVIDVKDVLSKGYFTFDPGFMATAACESKITFIDGDQGCCCIVATRLRNWPNKLTI